MKTRSSRNVVVGVLVTLALSLGLVSVAFADGPAFNQGPGSSTVQKTRLRVAPSPRNSMRRPLLDHIQSS